MSERKPSRAAAPVELGSMEGNVVMPQTHMAITLLGLNAGLSSEDPKAAFAHLLDPMPDDERMMDRTRKANAQHSFWGVQKTLQPYQVRRIEAGGNLYMLHMLASSLIRDEMFPTPSKPRSPAAGERWATDIELHTLERVLEELTPERAAKLREIVNAASAVLRSPEVRALLTERKELYGSLATVPLDARDSVIHSTDKIAEDITNRVHKAVEEAALRGGSEEREMGEAFAGALAQNFLNEHA